MAASAWVLFDRAKHYIGDGTIDLSGGEFRISLHSTGASANLVGDITIKSSVGSECTGGGYVAGGQSLTGVTWTQGASAGQQRWDATDPVFTASASALLDVRYAVIATSVTATSGILLTYAALSTAQFTVTAGNTLTIQLNANGIFTLA
jgi:hypothetical protein